MWKRCGKTDNVGRRERKLRRRERSERRRIIRRIL
jgi:hypothetical protein